MTPAEKLADGIDTFIDAIGRITAWSSFALALVMGGNVLLRYGFNTGSVWSQELEWHLLAPLVLIGMTYALNKGDHVRVDVLYARYSPRGQALVDFIAALLAIGMAVFVIRYSIPYVQQSLSIGEVSADPGGLTHRWLLKGLIPLGFALFALQAAAQAVAAWRRFVAPAPA